MPWTCWRTRFSSISQYEQTFLRYWEKLKIQYGRQRPSWMHLHVIPNTQWQYIMINFHPEWAQICHPFRSRSNHFWDIEEDGNSNMPASSHLGCTFMLFIQHSDYKYIMINFQPCGPKFSSVSLQEQPFLRYWGRRKIQYGRRRPSWMHLHVIHTTKWLCIMINFNPVGPDFHPFRSRTNRFWDIEEDVKSNMAAGGHLGYTFMLFVQHSDYISWLTLTLLGPDFHPFRSRSNCFRDIQKDRKIQYGRWRPSWVYLHFNRKTHYQYIVINLTLWAQIFHPFRSTDSRFWNTENKNEKLAYFGLSGPDLRPLERFNQIQLYTQSKLP